MAVVSHSVCARMRRKRRSMESAWAPGVTRRNCAAKRGNAACRANSNPGDDQRQTSRRPDAKAGHAGLQLLTQTLVQCAWGHGPLLGGVVSPIVRPWLLFR